MKATGIVRRVDDLGRVVIPKEIRRVLGIREGEALEIYTVDKGVVFRKLDHTLSSDAEALLGHVQAFYGGDPRIQSEIESSLREIITKLKKSEREY